MQKLVTQLLWRKHIHPLPCYGSVSIWEESQQHTWKERKCCLPTPPQSYQTPNTDIGFDWNFSASVKCMHILKRWVLVLPIHRIKINYVYLTQQIAAEGCAISSKTWRIWGWSERLDVPVFHQAVRALPDDKTILLPKWNWPKKMKNWREGKKKKKQERRADTQKDFDEGLLRFGQSSQAHRRGIRIAIHSSEDIHRGLLLSQTALHSDAVEKAGGQTGNLKQRASTHKHFHHTNCSTNCMTQLRS